MNIQPHKSTIVVTGGTGFIGAYVIRDLVNAGYSVKATRRSQHLPAFIDKKIFDKVQWFDTDIFDVEGLEMAMENADAVVHCAAKVSFAEKDRGEIFHTNIEGTANVVNTAIEKNIQRFIYVSSVAAIGRRKDGSLVNENAKWVSSKLHTSYSISKHNAEMEVWRGIAEGLNAVIVNPSTVLGYGDWNSSSSAIFKNAYNEFPWYTNGINGFVDVEDVAKAIVSLLSSNVHSERFILNGDNWSYRKLFDTIADAFGKKKPYKEATRLLGSIAWRLEKFKAMITGNKPLLTRETARIAQTNTKFDNNKILKALPDFSFTPLEHTIQKACKQYIL
jgi:dihydroflavonol-4-reductase